MGQPGRPSAGVPERAPRVVVVGSIMVDLIAYADPLPAAGQTLRGSDFKLGCGGKGANQAVCAGRLGADVLLIARVGTDTFGELSLANLDEQALDRSRVSAVPGIPTGVAPIWVDGDGSNRIIIVPGANDTLSGAEVAAQLADVAGADCVVCQLEIPLDAVAVALEAGARLNAVRILNPAPATADCIPLFANADWVVPNEHEFELLWGSPPGEGEIIAAAKQWGCGLIVTLGERGVVATIDTGEVVHRSAPPVSAVDTTGAGDAFVGALAYALGSGQGLEAALALGNACGALSTEAHGTQTSFPTLAAAEAMLHRPEARLGAVRDGGR